MGKSIEKGKAKDKSKGKAKGKSIEKGKKSKPKPTPTHIPKEVEPVSASVTNAEFVLIWQQASSVEEVANKLGILKGSASQRASNLRKKKVKLKRMPRSVSQYTVEELNSLIEQAAEYKPKAVD